MKVLFKEDYQSLKSQVQSSIGQLHQFTTDIGHEPLKETVGEILERIHDPFLFVIVGEVKAGKSSFINALLGTEEEICKVAASPMTDTIQQIVYGESISETSINPYLKRITHPEEILKEIAIVDTPGTNTIVDHHQEITERFIPHADLIVFVFEAKNPYRQSSWEFFDYINEDWRKKIIFVLQQKDLMEEADLITNLHGVTDNAKQKGITVPNVFAVSAKMELEGISESGFDKLKNYIQSEITGGKAPYLKLQNNANTANNINGKIAHSLELRTTQFNLDKEFRDDIKETLETQKLKTEKQIDFLVENLLASYDRITQKMYNDLGEGLSFIPVLRRSISSLIGNKDEGPKEWLERLADNFEKDLNIALKDKLQNGVVDIADNIQTMAKLVDAKIKTSETVLPNSDEIFADIADRRANVLKDLQSTFSEFLNKSENFYDKSLLKESEKMAPNLMTGGSIAIGGILMMILGSSVFDITGGILTGIGLLFAGPSIGLKKRKILKEYKSEISEGRVKLEEEVTRRLREYTENIKFKIDANFTKFDSHLQGEKLKLESLNSLKQNIHSSLTETLSKINRHL